MKWCNALCGVLALLLLPAMGWSQSFMAAGGTSQMLGESGFKLDYAWQHFSGWYGMGFGERGTHVGGLFKTSFKQNTVELGDQFLPLTLETDVLPAAQAFSVRGGLFRRKGVSFFSGVSTDTLSTPFSASYRSRDLVNAVLLERRWDKLTFHSFLLNPFTDRFSDIASLGWQARPNLKLAAAGGLGSGAPYLNGLVQYDGRTYGFDASYAQAGDTFRRVDTPFYATEPVKSNVRFHWTTGAARFDLNHENRRTFYDGQPPVLASLDSVNAFAAVKNFSIGGGIGFGDVGGQRNRSEMVSVTRRVLPFLTSFASLVRLDSAIMTHTALVTTNAFRVNPHLSLRQNYSRLDGRNAFTVGGQWISNPVTLSMDHQVFFNPLAIGGRQLFQSWVFGVHLRLPRGNLTLDTIVDPQGRVRYGSYITGLGYRRIEEGSSPFLQVRFSSSTIRGRVTNTAGKGVFGIAVRIGEQLLFSDNNGEFFIHVNDGRPRILTVEPSSSLQTAPWELKSAPSLATSDHPIAIVVEMK